MRRPVFKRWIRRECLRLANAPDFNLAKLAALAQSPGNGSAKDEERKRSLAAALHLYALSNNCAERLATYVYSKPVRRIQTRVESHIGGRDIQRLALRGTPMRTLPEEYRNLFDAYADAFRAPERIAAAKAPLQRKSRRLQITHGVSSAEIAKAVGVAPTNIVAYLKNGAIEKVTLDTAREILAYLSALDVQDAHSEMQHEERLP